MWPSLSRSIAASSSSCKPKPSSFLHRAAYLLNRCEPFSIASTEVKEPPLTKKDHFISFVLGGPGSGKGTQCAKIVETFGYLHLSAGELLRRELTTNSECASMILDTIKEGKIVPSEVTIRLIEKEIKSSNNKKFLIDGFPRNEENRIAFEKIFGVDPDAVIFFDCPEEVMVKRVLSRREDRLDDNLETIKKRIEVFNASHFPVLKYYSERGKLHKINAVGTEDEIFERVRPVFAAFEQGSKAK